MKYNVKQLLMQSFNFTYAGQVNIFIVPDRKKYKVCTEGIEIDKQGIVFFKHDYKVRMSYDTLWDAMAQFRYLCNKCMESFDWYRLDHFTNEFEKICLKDLK